MLKSPFPWFGGKSRVARQVWTRFGSVKNYVEPFFGSGAVLLNRPSPITGNETVNDLDGFVCNFWRALKADPEGVAFYAGDPVNECDLHARNVWLVERREKLQRRLEGDVDFFDVRVAGYWVWGVSCWIGSGFACANGHWTSIEVDGHRELVNLSTVVNSGAGVRRQLPHLGDSGKGVKRQLPHLGDSGAGLLDYMLSLAHRLCRVRVACGDWQRVLTDSVTHRHGVTAVFLDPPYSTEDDRNDKLYAHSCVGLAEKVRDWAVVNGENPLMRIALCGYQGDYRLPDNWTVFTRKETGGYGNHSKVKVNTNRHRECVWFSPYCDAALDDLYLFTEES